MKTESGEKAYDILRWENGEWVPCGFGDSRDQGKVKPAQVVLDRVAEGQPGELKVGGQIYWIKPARG